MRLSNQKSSLTKAMRASMFVLKQSAILIVAAASLLHWSLSPA